ncbi:MAG TPA: ATP-dependent Clp protease adapter ClpS [Candidatus Hydrogenedentes bacterium]|nr:ATP-dependent Clp protease adapter ClpS [Candidatus Hydrogenedentota bacterium]
MPEYISQPGDAAVAETKQKVKRPPMYRVLMHNDDYTTMEFVVETLCLIYGKSFEDAFRIMLQIHHKGIGMCGVYTQEIAETKIAETHERARSSGFPLLCSMEPAE